MIIVNFDKNELCKKAYGLWQYDYGQVLRIQGLNLPTAAEIHFALQETGGEAVTRIGITKDGVTDVTIPDSLLEADGASQDYQIYVFVYLATPESGETTRRITLGVKSRPRPEAFNTPGEGKLFEEAIQAVNNAAKRAEDAGKEATAAAGEARKSASLAGKYLADTKVLAEQVEINADLVAQGKEEAARLLAQTQEAASDAALSAETAKQSEVAAKQAQTATETAEDAARQYAAETEADRQEVAESKQSVEQMQSDVARMQTDVQADKDAVEQTVSEFGTAAQNALTAIGQAQNTAVSAVQTEGQKQATAVQETGTQAVSEVDVAKTAAVEAVTAEGDVQVGRVEDAAAEIVADREQIQQNKTDIAALTDKTNTLAPGIVLGAKGGAVAVSNASEQPLVGLNVYGKSEQVRTTGAQLFDASKIPTTSMSGATIINNGDGSFTIEGTGKITEGFSVQHNYSHEETVKLLKPGTITLSTNKNTYPYLRIAIGKDLYMHNKYNSPVTSANITEELLADENTTLQIRVFGSSGDSIVGGTFTPMLYQDGDGTWEPYTGAKTSPSTEYPQDIVNAGDAGEINVRVCGKNFFDVSKVEDTFNGTYGLINNNGILTVTSSEKDSTVTTNKTLRELCPELVEGRQYVLYANSTGNAKKIYLSGAAKEAWEFGKTKTITKTHLESLVRFYADTNVATTAVIKDIQIELGSTATDYEPYKPAQSLTLATPNGLAGIPVKSGGNYTDENGQQWITDEIDCDREVKIQRIYTYVFTGNEQIDETYLPTLVAILPKETPTGNAGPKNRPPMLSNYTTDINFSNTNGNSVSFKRVEEYWGVKNGAELKGFLKTRYDSGKPVVVQYVLATPIETPLTSEEIAAYKSLHTYSPNTTVTNDSGCGMSVEYVADTKTYIQSVEDKITAIQAALINQNISGGYNGR